MSEMNLKHKYIRGIFIDFSLALHKSKLLDSAENSTLDKLIDFIDNWIEVHYNFEDDLP
jgi:hypothetical protein